MGIRVDKKPSKNEIAERNMAERTREREEWREHEALKSVARREYIAQHKANELRRHEELEHQERIRKQVEEKSRQNQIDTLKSIGKAKQKLKDLRK